MKNFLSFFLFLNFCAKSLKQLNYSQDTIKSIYTDSKKSAIDRISQEKFKKNIFFWYIAKYFSYKNFILSYIFFSIYLNSKIITFWIIYCFYLLHIKFQKDFFDAEKSAEIIYRDKYDFEEAKEYPSLIERGAFI